MEHEDPIINSYFEFIDQKEFPCVAAKAALSKEQIRCYVASHMMCPADDQKILDFLYGFIDEYRNSETMYHSAAVIFRGPGDMTEEQFDNLLFQCLQRWADLDAKNFSYDSRVSPDPKSAEFSFSLKEEAFFIIGLHPANNRATRRFAYPTLVFNPHAQFQRLKETAKYGHLKEVVRKRDKLFSGSVNPMLEDFGNASEVYQYSGRAYDNTWECPLRIKHKDEHNSAA